MISSLNAVARVLEFVPTLVGRAAAWLVLVTVGTCAFVAIARYGFSYGNACLQELYVAAFGVSFLLTAPLAYARDAHVRIGLLGDRLRPGTRAAIELIGCLAFLLPWLAVIVWSSAPFVRLAWAVMETSPQAGGCAVVPFLGWPLPFYAILKSILPAFAGLMALQAVATILRSLAVILARPRR